MSLEHSADVDYGLARQQWQQADQAARLAYVEQVQQLQRQYEDDIRPFRDAYNSAERVTWMEYQSRIRANWDAYHRAMNAIAVPDTPATITDPPTEGNPQ